MRPSEGPGSIDVPVRAFSYDSGAGGPEFTRAVAVEAPIQIVIGGAPFAVMMATPQRPRGFRLRLCPDRADRRERRRYPGRRGRARRGRLEAQDRAVRRAIAGASRARPGDERAHRLRPLRHRGFFPDALAPAAAPSAGPRSSPPRSAPPLANSRRGSRSIRLTRAVHAAAWCGRDGTNRPCPRGRRTAQCARQGDRGAGARAASRRTADSLSSPAAVRSKWSPRRRSSARAPWCRFRRRPRSRSSGRRRFGVRLIAVARGDQALCFDGGKDDASGGLAA